MEAWYCSIPKGKREKLNTLFKARSYDKVNKIDLSTGTILGARITDGLVRSTWTPQTGPPWDSCTTATTCRTLGTPTQRTWNKRTATRYSCNTITDSVSHCTVSRGCVVTMVKAGRTTLGIQEGYSRDQYYSSTMQEIPGTGMTATNESESTNKVEASIEL